MIFVTPEMGGGGGGGGVHSGIPLNLSKCEMETP